MENSTLVGSCSRAVCTFNVWAWRRGGWQFGAPRSLIEASKASLTNKGKSEARESPLDRYVFWEDTTLQVEVDPHAAPPLRRAGGRAGSDAGGGRGMMLIRVRGPVRESQRLGGGG